VSFLLKTVYEEINQRQRFIATTTYSQNTVM